MAGEHTTVDQVARWLGGVSPEDPTLEPAVAAANALVTRYTAEEPTEASSLAATMLAARLHRRRNSADGVQTLSPELAARVASGDPDVARLLRIDQFEPPAAI